MAKGVVFLPSYHDAISGLPDADRLQMYDAIVRYGLYGEIIDLPPILNALFQLCKPIIDNSNNRYAAAVANGAKGGRPKNQTGNQNQNQDKDKDKDKDKDFDRECERELQGGDFPPAYKPLPDADFNDSRERAIKQIEDYMRRK